jgi:hypothetical protein
VTIKESEAKNRKDRKFGSTGVKAGTVFACILKPARCQLVDMLDEAFGSSQYNCKSHTHGYLAYVGMRAYEGA